MKPGWPAGSDVTVAVAPEPLIEPSAEPATADAARQWLCAWCLNPVANENERFQYEGRDEFSFKNPEGMRFEIITFARSLGCRQNGAPTLEHTWFAGHAWSFCHCARCGQHLGWYYAGPHHFIGLIKNRIVRALLVRN